MKELVTTQDLIQKKIFHLRGTEVMLDRDLAELYQVETRALKQAVKRNIQRFPDDFMFELIESEIDLMVSQSVIPSKQHLGGAKPFAFTEQGIANLSSILKSDVAVDVNIKIMRAFVFMRKLISQNMGLFQRVENIEHKLTTHDKRFEKLFEAIDSKTTEQKFGIFFDGEIFDAYVFISELIKGAKDSIILIDNYIDESVLTHLSKNQKVDISIYTHTISKSLKLDLLKYNTQYKPIEIKEYKNAHDRFIIIDKKEIYHIGASLKDLGKKWFGFSKFETDAFELLKRLP